MQAPSHSRCAARTRRAENGPELKATRSRSGTAHVCLGPRLDGTGALSCHRPSISEALQEPIRPSGVPRQVFLALSAHTLTLARHGVRFHQPASRFPRIGAVWIAFEGPQVWSALPAPRGLDFFCQETPMSFMPSVQLGATHAAAHVVKACPVLLVPKACISLAVARPVGLLALPLRATHTTSRASRRRPRGRSPSVLEPPPPGDETVRGAAPASVRAHHSVKNAQS